MKLGAPANIDKRFSVLLRDAKLKTTPQRMALLKLLSEVVSPLTVEDIYGRLEKKMNTVTIYRSMESLVSSGIARRVDFQHTHAHYELEAGREHHHHIICTMCGCVEDVAVPLIEKLHTQLLKRSARFSSIESHALEFFGTCIKCKK